MHKRFLQILLASMIVLLGCVTFTPSVLAAQNQSTRAAKLTAPSADFKINIYLKPDPKIKRLGYGLSGDPVKILEQMSNNKGYSWYKVKFENPPNAEGWVKGDYISLSNQATRQGKDGYLGGQSQPSNRQNQLKGYQRQYNN